jgi:hypothetical protein
LKSKRKNPEYSCYETGGIHGPQWQTTSKPGGPQELSRTNLEILLAVTR